MVENIVQNSKTNLKFKNKKIPALGAGINYMEDEYGKE